MTTGDFFTNREKLTRLIGVVYSKQLSDADKADDLLRQVFFIFNMLDEIKKVEISSNPSPAQIKLIRKINTFFEEIGTLKGKSESVYGKIRADLTEAYREGRLRHTEEVKVEKKTLDEIIGLTDKIRSLCLAHFSKTYPGIQHQLEKNEQLLSEFMLAYMHYSYACLREGSVNNLIEETANLAEVLCKCMEAADEKNLYKGEEENIKNAFFESIRRKIDLILEAGNFSEEEKGRIRRNLESKKELPDNINTAMLAKLKCAQLNELYQIRLQKIKEIKDLPNQKEIIKELDAKIKANLKKIAEQDEKLIHFIFQFCQENKIFEVTSQFQDLPVGDIQKIIEENIAAKQMSWSQWIRTQTFSTRMSSAIGVLFGGASLGIGAGFMLGGPVGVVLSALPSVLTSFTGAAAAFFAPEIKGHIQQGRENFLRGLQGMFITLQSSFLQEFPPNGLAEHYKPTQKMIGRFTSKGAENIAKWYVNNLFKLQIEIKSNPSNKASLQECYFYLLLNYQMLRGDEVQIQKIFQSLSWGQELAAKQINAMHQCKEDDLLNEAVKLVMALESEKIEKQQAMFFNAVMKLDELNAQLREPANALVYEEKGESSESSIKIEEITDQDFDDLREKREGKEEEKAEEKEKKFQIVHHQQGMTRENAVVLAKIKSEESRCYEIIESNRKIEISQKERLNEVRTIYQYSKMDSGSILLISERAVELDTDLSINKIKNLFERKDYRIFQNYWVDEILLAKNDPEIKQSLSGTVNGTSILQCLVNDLSEGGPQLDILIAKLEQKGKYLPSYCSIEDIQAALKVNNQPAIQAYLEALKRQYPLIKNEQDKEIARRMLEEIVKNQVRSDEVFVCGKLAELIEGKLQEEKQKSYTYSVLQPWGAGSTVPVVSKDDVYFELLVSALEFEEDFKTGRFVPQKYQDYLPFLLEQEIEGMLYRNKEREEMLETSEMQQFRRNVESSVILSEDQKKIFRAVFDGDRRFLENNSKIIVEMLYTENKKVDGKNLFWLAIKLNDDGCLNVLYQAVIPRTTVTSYVQRHPDSMRSAAPPDKSAFILAAQEKDKSCFKVFAQPIFSISGVPIVKPFSRFEKDERGRTALHYIAETGEPRDIVAFLGLQGLSLIGETSKWNKNHFAELDQEGNSPMALLLQREDAAACIEEMYKFFAERYAGQTITGQEYCGTFFDLDSSEDIDKALNKATVIFERNPELSRKIVRYTCELIENKKTINDLEGTLRRCIIMSTYPFDGNNFSRSIELFFEKIPQKTIFDILDVEFFKRNVEVEVFIKRAAIDATVINKTLQQIKGNPATPAMRRAFFECIKFCCLMGNQALLEQVIRFSKDLYQANNPYYLSYFTSNPLDHEFEVFYHELSSLALSKEMRQTVNEQLSAVNIGPWCKTIEISKGKQDKKSQGKEEEKQEEPSSSPSRPPSPFRKRR